MSKTRTILTRRAREIRRAEVMKLLATGYSSGREIADKLNVSFKTVYRDINYLTGCADIDMKNHFKSLPLEIKKCTAGLDLTIKTLTDIIDSEDIDTDLKLGALNTRMNAYRFKMEILDGKANLKQVFEFIDSYHNQNQDRVLQTRIAIH
jgi:hypothetical protein